MVMDKEGTTEARAYTFSGVTTPVWSCRQAQKKEVKRLLQTHQSSLTAIVPTPIPTPKRQKRVTQENALVHQKNIKYFENCFGETFTVPPKEEKNNTVTVIYQASSINKIFFVLPAIAQVYLVKALYNYKVLPCMQIHFNCYFLPNI